MNAESGKSITSTATKLFTGACSNFLVGCRAESANEALINIPSLHGKDYFPVFPGGEQEFVTLGINGIKEVNVKSAGTSTIDYGVTGKAGQ
jgi:hypothetical protein